MDGKEVHEYIKFRKADCESKDLSEICKMLLEKGSIEDLDLKYL